MIRKPIADKDSIACQHHLVNRMVADKALLGHSSRPFACLKDVAHLKKDADLDPLRSREGFQKLLRELTRKEGP